jgi:uncharacterized membrane protein
LASSIVLKPVTLGDLASALRAGLGDFRRAPLFGLFFGGVYVGIGLGLVWMRAGAFTWTLVVSLGFPLFAPFAAVGLYEVSRRLEQGRPLSWPGVLGVILAERDRQLPWMGAIIVIYVLFWTFLGHMIFALFMGPSALVNATTGYDMYLTEEGLTMLAFGGAVGAGLAVLLFALTVVSLPLLLDREVDFVTAMLTSLRLVRQNLAVMLVWAAAIAAALLVALVPAFLGLLAALPVLGHATWHLYRRAVV